MNRTTIGLIGFSNDSSAIEYYRYMLEITNQKSFNLQFDVVIHCIKKYENENIIISRLCDVYFDMMSNGVKNLVFANHELEMLSHYINMPVGPFTLHSSFIIATEIKKLHITKVVVLDLSLNSTLGFFLNDFKKEQLDFVVLCEGDRKKIKKMLDEESNLNQLSQEVTTELENMFKKLPEYGVEGILVDSPDLNSVIKQLHITLPTFYIRKIHAQHALNYLPL